MNSMFSVAYAQGPTGGQPSLTVNLLLFGGMILLFYLILWRPQAKRAREHRELVAAIAKGDEVMTNGGLLGKVTAVGEEHITLEVASGVAVKLQKSAVSAVLPKGTLKEI